MTVKELREAIENWPEDTVVEVSVGKEATLDSPNWEKGRVWHELCDSTLDESINHGLLIAGKIVMC